MQMQRVSGRLGEVVSYESRTAGGLLGREALTNYFLGENVLHEIFRFWI